LAAEVIVNRVRHGRGELLGREGLGAGFARRFFDPRERRPSELRLTSRLGAVIPTHRNVLYERGTQQEIMHHDGKTGEF